MTSSTTGSSGGGTSSDMPGDYGPAPVPHWLAMATGFTKIIDGELPGRFVWQDDRCVAFLSINPIRRGHTLVVPTLEVDHWLDLEPELASHLFGVSQTIGRALQRAFEPEKVGLMIAGLEVRHVHLHLVPMDDIHDLDFARQDPNPDPKALDRAAEAIRAVLRDLGFEKEAAGRSPGAGG